MLYVMAALALFPMLGVAAAEPLILNDQKYVSSDGTLHIVGEVDNNLDVPIGQVKIHASLYSDSGALLGDISSDAKVNSIYPGMKAPFDIIISDIHRDDVQAYVLDLDYAVAQPKSQAMGIESSDLYHDGLDNLVISGTVSNNGDITANAVSVVATLYDARGDVVAVSESHTEPDYLRSSGEAFFLVTVPDRAQADVVDYALVAESEEYAAVPEFPLGSGLLLALSVFAYLALTKYWAKTAPIAGAAVAAYPR